jgi:hypothetical protein
MSVGALPCPGDGGAIAKDAALEVGADERPAQSGLLWSGCSASWDEARVSSIEHRIAEIEKGCSPGYIDNGDGTITDVCFKLIWTQAVGEGHPNWDQAVKRVCA